MENSLSSNDSFASSTVQNDEQLRRCGVACKLKVSWTEKKPGRRFLGCGRYDGFNAQCNFFSWYDPPVNNCLSSIDKGIRLRNIELENVMETQSIEIGILKQKFDTEKAEVHVLSEKLDKEKAAVKVLNGKLDSCQAKILELSLQVESLSLV